MVARWCPVHIGRERTNMKVKWVGTSIAWVYNVVQDFSAVREIKYQEIQVKIIKFLKVFQWYW